MLFFATTKETRGRLESPTQANLISMKSKTSLFSLEVTYQKSSNPFRLQIHQWSDQTIRKVVRDNWAVRGGHINRTLDMMVTPRVTKEIRDHFSCQKLEGAELEDQGGEGTALTHWEKRVLEVSIQNHRIHID